MLLAESAPAKPKPPARNYPVFGYFVRFRVSGLAVRVVGLGNSRFGHGLVLLGVELLARDHCPQHDPLLPVFGFHVSGLFSGS